MPKKEENSDSKKTDKSNSKKGARFDKQHEGKLKEFFVDELKDIYYAEDAILDGLKKLEEAATSSKLKNGLQKHHKQTEKHVKRLEKAFELADEKPSKKKCEAIVGLLKEADDVIKDTEEDTMVRDVAIILAAQKVEHYEIATYGSLVELANTIGMEEVATLLEETLQEEKNTDVLLTELAVESINPKASEE